MAAEKQTVKDLLTCTDNVEAVGVMTPPHSDFSSTSPRSALSSSPSPQHSPYSFEVREYLLYLFCYRSLQSIEYIMALF